MLERLEDFAHGYHQYSYPKDQNTPPWIDAEVLHL